MTTLSQAVSVRESRQVDLSGKSGSRALKNSIATAAMWTAFGIAVIATWKFGLVDWTNPG